MEGVARHRLQQKTIQNNETKSAEARYDTEKKSFKLTLVHWLVILMLDSAIVYFIHSLKTRYPTPLGYSKGEVTKGRFIESNARTYLEGITKFGPRPVGSIENEKLTVDYLLKVITDIKQKANVVHKIEIDSRRTSGTFNLNFLGGFTSVYENVNNIMVKFGPQGGANDAVLINCHYDSVINATGASDDAVSCSLMLEVLRVLSYEEYSYSNEIIFMFNGGEENILQASHGFITQHPWASNIRAFINLEAGGAGGHELLFQAGPENPWLIKLYSENVPHPFASVVGQEVFQAGLIPSDTDYRIFRDYGKLPGLDIAYISNGYVYHTPFDVPQMIPPGCIQRGGDNLLALARGFGSSPWLGDPGEYKQGKLVFFDMLGLWMIIYPHNIGSIINFVVIAAVMIGIGKKITGPRRGILGRKYLHHLLVAVGVLVTSWILTALLIALVGFLTDLIGQPMSWFTNTWLLIGLYAAPAILVILFINEAAKFIIFDTYPGWEVEVLFFDANMLVFSIILSILTLKGVSSAVILLIFLIFPLLIRDRICSIFNITGKNSPQKLFLLHTLSTVIPVTLFLYTISTAMAVFIPIMGRSGATMIPDVFIGFLVSLTVVFTLSYHIGLVYVSSSTKPLQILLVWIWLISIIIATVTPLGFPYHANPQAPTKQRHIVHHIERTFHDLTGYVYRHDSGLLHMPFDRNSIHILRSHMPVLKDAILTDCRGPYCGWPYYFPLQHMFREMYYIPSPAPKLNPRASLQMVNVAQVDDKTQRWLLQVTGPNHVNVYLKPQDGIVLVNWSVGNQEVYQTQTLSGQPNYFIYYSYGTKPDKPWQFWIDLEITSRVSASEGVIDIALGAHYITTDGTNKSTPELDAYLGSFPDWTIPLGWAATYESWSF